ncbi:T9SS type A sorting domain-containing protein [Rhodocytophaga rosea]|uniref:T9SS type A sorting domain-containing protein n=1 Tax=Rhodocytophaga rosea TaxID=2704465 RepID=A0A6C0GTP8_9BACT|nr:T9SS type A sorting domain-containing protein [Rhodocytophaga rosea]QHT71539.1 T9SS type A sorting domain-containing protein [Rhodocytophaga rosea]
MKKIIQLFLLITFSFGILPLHVFAQTYYWIGGSGNWNDKVNWSFSSSGTPIANTDPLPGPTNDVVFDDPLIGNYTVTINPPGAICRNLNWQDIDGINPTLTGAGGLKIEIYGSLNLPATVSNNFPGTFELKGAGNFTLNATSPFPTGSILLFNNPAGIWKLADKLDVYNLRIQSGELDVQSNDNSIDVKGYWYMTPAPSVAAKFNSQGGTVVFNGSGTQTITTNAALGRNEFFNMIIENSGPGITLNSPVSVGKNNGGRITFIDGIVNTTPTNILTINNRAQVSGARDGSHVNGYVRKIGNDGDNEFYFPIGDGTSYRPAGLEFVNPNPNAVFVAKYNRRTPANVNYPPANANSPLTISKFEYWEIERTGGNASTRVILTWEIPVSGPENYLGEPANVEDLLVAYWNSSNPLTGEWRRINSNNQTVTNSNPANYSGHTRMQSAMANNDRRVYAIGSEILPLPIELLYFKANLVNGVVQLDWATASEKDNDYFTIEKSTDSKQFEAFLEVDAIGNSQQVQTYTAPDANPLSPVTYYRLKQTDIDGKFTYSKIVAIHSGSKASLSVTPLTEKQIRLSYYLPQSKDAVLSLYDTKGVLVWNKSVSGNSALQAEIIKLSYPSGMYLLTMQQAGEAIVKKIFIR